MMSYLDGRPARLIDARVDIEADDLVYEKLEEEKIETAKNAKIDAELSHQPPSFEEKDS